MNFESLEALEKKKIPLFIYETSATGFQRQAYTLATSDSERIAVDHVAKSIDPTSRSSRLSQNMQSSLNAVKLLRSRLKFLIDMVRNSKEVQADHNFMRRLNNIVAQVPIATKDQFDKAAFNEYSDIANINLLSNVTKGMEMLNELMDDFKVMQSKEVSMGHMGSGGGGFGHFGRGDDMDDMMMMMAMQQRP